MRLNYSKRWKCTFEHAFGSKWPIVWKSWLSTWQTCSLDTCIHCNTHLHSLKRFSNNLVDVFSAAVFCAECCRYILFKKDFFYYPLCYDTEALASFVIGLMGRKMMLIKRVSQIFDLKVKQDWIKNCRLQGLRIITKLLLFLQTLYGIILRLHFSCHYSICCCLFLSYKSLYSFIARSADRPSRLSFRYFNMAP